MNFKKHWCTSCGAIVEADANLTAAYCQKCGDRIDFNKSQYSNELLGEDIDIIVEAACRTEEYNKELVEHLSNKGMISAILYNAVHYIKNYDYENAMNCLQKVYEKAKNGEARDELNETIRCMVLLACVKYKCNTTLISIIAIIDFFDVLEKTYGTYANQKVYGEEAFSFVRLCSEIKKNLKDKYAGDIANWEREKNAPKLTLADNMGTDNSSVTYTGDYVYTGTGSSLTNEDHDILDSLTSAMDMWPDVSDI